MQRLTQISGEQTLRLTHYGRRSGRPYQVTIWFVLDRTNLYLGTANANRQWVRNVKARPNVLLRIGGETSSGLVSELADFRERQRVFGLFARKYWFARPLMWLGRLLVALDVIADRRAVFRVRIDNDVN